MGEPGAVLAMVNGEQHTQVISNVMQYAALHRADKAWKGKNICALGDRNEKGEDPPFVHLRPSYLDGARCATHQTKKIRGQWPCSTTSQKTREGCAT